MADNVRSNKVKFTSVQTISDPRNSHVTYPWTIDLPASAAIKSLGAVGKHCVGHMESKLSTNQEFFTSNIMAMSTYPRHAASCASTLNAKLQMLFCCLSFSFAPFRI